MTTKTRNQAPTSYYCIAYIYVHKEKKSNFLVDHGKLHDICSTLNLVHPPFKVKSKDKFGMNE